VPGKAAGDDEQSVDPDIVAVAGEAFGKPLGGDRDPAEAVSVEREFGGFARIARLHLDEGNCPATAGDDVDFAAGNASSAGEDSPALQPQIPAGQRLGSAAALFRLSPVHLPESSSARA